MSDPVSICGMGAAAPRRSRDAGFSLMEILIALAIVGILAAIAVPGLYNGLVRDQVVESGPLIDTARKKVAAYWAGSGTMPATNHDAGLPVPEKLVGNYVRSIVVRDGVIYTPDLTSALEGITRDTIIRFAVDLGIPVKEKRITRDEVYIADEAFFTGTAAEVTPIREVDGRLIGNGRRGPMTQRLQELYFDQVQGRRDEYPEWLTPV